MRYLVEQNEELKVLKTNRPDLIPGLIGPVPAEVLEEEEGYLRYRDVPHPTLEGQTVREIYVHPDLKSLGESDKIIAFNEKKWSDMRRKRDQLLKDTDFTQLSDCPLSSSVKAAYVSYRQALRDLPETIEDIDNFTWPEKP